LHRVLPHWKIKETLNSLDLSSYMAVLSTAAASSTANSLIHCKQPCQLEQMPAANDERSQECDTTQRPEASSEQVGGTSHSRERVVDCSAVLSIVGKELSSLPASISPDASD
jgi:hypothetical protein